MRIRVEKILFGIIILALLIGLLNVLVSHTQENKNRVEKQTLANPASVHCDEVGGTLHIQTRGDGGEYGVCMFEDNRQCEEWALYRSECPVGGINVTGYDTKEQVYCAITGGVTLAIKNATCKLPNGAECSNESYYNGLCG